MSPIQIDPEEKFKVVAYLPSNLGSRFIVQQISALDKYALLMPPTYEITEWLDKDFVGAALVKRGFKPFPQEQIFAYKDITLVFSKL